MTKETDIHADASATFDDNDPEAVALAERLKTERQYIGMSQAEVADALGITRAAVSALETGRRRVTSLELKRFAALYGTSADQLLGKEVVEDAATAALFRTAKGLRPDDMDQVLRFAEFLKAAGQAPQINPNSG